MLLIFILKVHIRALCYIEIMLTLYSFTQASCRVSFIITIIIANLRNFIVTNSRINSFSNTEWKSEGRLAKRVILRSICFFSIQISQEEFLGDVRISSCYQNNKFLASKGNKSRNNQYWEEAAHGRIKLLFSFVGKFDRFTEDVKDRYGILALLVPLDSFCYFFSLLKRVSVSLNLWKNLVHVFLFLRFFKF